MSGKEFHLFGNPVFNLHSFNQQLTNLDSRLKSKTKHFLSINWININTHITYVEKVSILFDLAVSYTSINKKLHKTM
jgi:hypothetical protein